ncbi:MAG: hypothetical protein ACRC0L_06130 [Angustibacter sp.]
MASLGSYSYIYGPLVALAAMALLAFLLRWAFRRGRSLVARPIRPGAPDDYGLLIPVATAENFVEAELIRMRLVAGGIRATLAPTTDGPRILVFPAEESAARAILRQAP